MLSNGRPAHDRYYMIYVSFNILIKSNYAWESAFAHPVRLSVGGPKIRTYIIDISWILYFQSGIKKAVCKRQPVAYYLIVKITLTPIPVPARLPTLFRHLMLSGNKNVKQVRYLL